MRNVHVAYTFSTTKAHKVNKDVAYSKRAKRSLYALCSLCTFVVEKAITLRFVFFVHFCGGKSDHSTLCVLKKERSDHSTLCILCALLWWKK
jgi:hypothetical protein